MKNSLIITIIISAALIFPACSPKVIYVKGNTEVQYRDSIIHQIDSVEVPLPVEVIKEVTPLLDPLHMEITNAVADAWVDTNTNTLQGTLKSRGNVTVPVDNKQEFHYRDSVQITEIPVPVETIKKVTPKWALWSVAVNLFLLILLGTGIYVVLRR